MSKLRFKISMSLDGFVAGPTQSVVKWRADPFSQSIADVAPEAWGAQVMERA